MRDAIKMLGPSRKFTKFVPIPSARIPILKCLHISTGYQCDLNFSDAIGVFNSPILASLLQYDERIYDIAIVLKYWLKIHDLAGSFKLSNYALLWLLIFYLQQLRQPIIPPIKAFQANIAPYYVNEMNLAFNQRLPNKTRNRQRQSELLLGFFEFYNSFDFESQIICPLHGKAFPKENVFERFPNEFAAYNEVLARRPDSPGLKLNKTICIQDPFDIIQTVPGPISKHHFAEIRSKIAMAATIFKRTLAEDGECGRLLLSIFNRNNFIEAVSENSKAQRSSFFIKIIPIESELVLMRKYIVKHQDTEAVIHAAEIKMMWCKHVIEYLIDMLANVYCLNVTYVCGEGAETASKSPKVDFQKDVHTNDLFKVVNVSGDKDVFFGRKQAKVATPTLIRTEIQTSKERYQKSQLKINFKASIKLAAALDSAEFVTMVFEDTVGTRKNNFFKGFQAMFSAGVRHFLKAYFAEFQANNDLGLHAPAIATTTTSTTNTTKTVAKSNNDQNGQLDSNNVTPPTGDDTTANEIQQ